MPVRNVLALFFRATNTLLIHKEHFDALDPINQHLVLRTETPCLEIHYPPNKPPLVTQRSK